MTSLCTASYVWNGEVCRDPALDALPLHRRSIFAVCVGIWAASLLTGLDNLAAVCLSPADVVSRLQLYRIVTAALFHAGLLHVALNMMAFLPLGASLERTMGSLHLLWLVLLLAFLGDAAYVAIAYAAAAAQLPAFLTQCAVGFSGVLFGLIVIDSNASGAAQRSIFGIVMVPTGAYPWALLVLWQVRDLRRMHLARAVSVQPNGQQRRTPAKLLLCMPKSPASARRTTPVHVHAQQIEQLSPTMFCRWWCRRPPSLGIFPV